MKRKFNPLWLLLITAFIIWFAVVANYRHEQKLNLHPVKDSVTFDTLHSEIHPSDTLKPRHRTGHKTI